MSTQARILYTLPEAAAAVSQSVTTLRQAIKATDPKSYPPPLRAKRDGKKYLLLHDDLVEWARSLPDA